MPSKPTTVVVATREGSCAPDHPAPVRDVVVVDFATSSTTSLNFSGQAISPCGSGTQSVFTVRRPGAGSTTAGVAYDIYAADTCSFWFYGVEPGASSNPQWDGIMSPSGPTQTCGSGIHADSWYVVFPKSYDPAKGVCTAYAATDGGVFVNSSSAKARSGSGCLLSSGWVTAMHGLHGFRSYSMAGISQPLSKCANPNESCPILYLPSGDNDVWASINGKNWGQLVSALGDAGEVHVDPAFPTQVMGSRGATYVVVTSSDGQPPLPGSANTVEVTPANASNSAALGGQTNSAPGNPELTQVMSLPGKSAEPAFYVTSESPPTSTKDVIVKNTASPPTASSWTALEASPSFALNQVAQIRSSGGLKDPVFYVLTVSGKVYKGSLQNGLVKKWNSVSKGLVNAEALFVDPYNSNVAYVSDVTGDGLPSIKSTSDGGKKWNPEPVLSKIAGNNGEFLSFSSVAGNVSNESYPPLSDMYFDRNNKNIRVAATYPGGVAFSDDAGKNWTQVLATNNGPNDGKMNPVGMVSSVFYDPVLNPQTNHPSLYVALRSRGLIEVDCPLCPAKPKCTAGVNCEGEFWISCTGEGVFVLFRGSCVDKGGDPVDCVAGPNGSDTITAGGIPSWTSPNEWVNRGSDTQLVPATAKVCTKNGQYDTCITVSGDPPSSCPAGPPGPPPKCPVGERWCDRFSPARCAPPKDCPLLTPDQPPQ